MTPQTDAMLEPTALKARMQAATLGALSQTEADALLNDLREAQALAAEYQRKLALKSNDLAALKQALERAMSDLWLLRTTVNELHAERRLLADQVTRLEWVKEKAAALAKRVLLLERKQAQPGGHDGLEENSIISINYAGREPNVDVFTTGLGRGPLAAAEPMAGRGRR